MKKLVLLAIGASMLASNALANNGVLFTNPNDLFFETPLEALARAKGRTLNHDAGSSTSARARKSLATPEGRAEQSPSDAWNAISDRLTREGREPGANR